MKKEYFHFFLKVLLALTAIGVLCDLVAWLAGIQIRNFIFRPLQAVGIYKPTSTGTSNSAPPAGGTSS